jgi:hypothetical protein
VTFDPEKGGQRCANSREKVTIHLEKGDFFNPQSAIRNHPEKGDLFPLISEVLRGKRYFIVPTAHPEKGDLSFRFSQGTSTKKE